MVTETLERLFSLEDVAEQEVRWGLWYCVTDDRKQMLPATHIGSGRVACITIHRSPMGDLVNWKVWDTSAGEVILHSTERNYSLERGAWRHAVRLAVRAIRSTGCETRVRPGDRGPWGSGAVFA